MKYIVPVIAVGLLMMALAVLTSSIINDESNPIQTTPTATATPTTGYLVKEVADYDTQIVDAEEEQGGLYVLAHNGTLYLDGVTVGQISVGRKQREEGALGLAVDGATAYIYYTAPDCDRCTALVRYRLPGLTLIDELVRIDFPPEFDVHVGGDPVVVGPLVYLATGDGGAAGSNAPNHSSLLRIDTRDGSVTPVATGFRNPWRMSYDGKVFWVGDIGDTLYEEINIVSDSGNYGWPLMEGYSCTESRYCTADHGQYVRPAYAYPHSRGRCAIMGGYVYHGHVLSELDGLYVYGDQCTGDLYAYDHVSGDNIYLTTTVAPLVSLGLTDDGEMLTISYNGSVGLLGRP